MAGPRTSHSKCCRYGMFAIVTFGLSIVVAVVFALAAPVAADSIEDALPGSSYTKYSPALAVRAWEMAATVAHIHDPGACETIKLIDTKVTSVEEQVVFSSSRKLKQGRWSELWIFDRCGKRVEILSKFTADGKGKADGEFSLRKLSERVLVP